MRNALLIAVGLVVGAVIGAAGTYLVLHPHDHKWIVLQTDGKGISVSSAAFLDVDVQLPELTPPTGRAKFLDRGMGKDLELGYVVRTRMESIDMSKVPKKYKTVEKHDTYTISPPDAFAYSAHLEFTLKDADGFVLMTTLGPSEELRSGRENIMQGIAKDSIPDATVQRAKGIFVKLSVDKCDTCRP